MDCKNCHNTLVDKSDYCYICGAKIIRNRLTIKNLFSHFSEQFLSWDNKFLKTFINLFKQPEDVIGSYTSGTRKRYINPISFLAISLTLSGIYLYILRNYFPNAMDFSSIQPNEKAQEITQQMTDKIMDYNSLFYFVLIPFLAIISIIVFYNKKYNYTEHVVIYLYTMSFGALISSFVAIIVLYTKPEFILTVSFSMNAIIILYHCYVHKRLFKLSFSQLLLKFLLFIVVFGFGYFMLSIALFIAIVMFSDISFQDFVPQQ